MAKSLIISFQYNIESVYFFYSNPVYRKEWDLYWIMLGGCVGRQILPNRELILTCSMDQSPSWEANRF